MLEPHDRVRLDEHGLALDDAAAQLAQLGGPRPVTALVRPCAVGDGIERLDAAALERAVEACRRAAATGRVSCFVPASGAATRMVAALARCRGFATRDELSAAAASGDTAAAETVELLDGVERLPFAGELDSLLGRRALSLGSLRHDGLVGPLLDALLSDDGLALAARPKGLVPFHVYGDEVRTALDEQLVSSRALVGGAPQVHVTVGAEHEAAFRAAADASHGARVTFSTQSPSTDTLALAADGSPLRDAAGRLVLRPGGHGALLRNLARSGGDLVAIRNIDNVQRDELARREWRAALVGRLVELQGELFEAIRGVRRGDPGAADAARRLLAGYGHDELRDAELLDALCRPIRVCGVVPNSGEPGGGPFWVRDAAGRATPQIVEGAQVDAADAGQRAIAAAATHFNPVDLVCALRDVDGAAYELDAFVDRAQALVSRKTIDGREATVLERPGLWNGAMAGWLTRFVEIPLETFTPVKTLADLLRPEHQPPPG